MIELIETARDTLYLIKNCIGLPLDEKSKDKTEKFSHAVYWAISDDSHLLRIKKSLELAMDIKEQVADKYPNAKAIRSVQCFNDPEAINKEHYGLYAWVEIAL